MTGAPEFGDTILIFLLSGFGGAMGLLARLSEKWYCVPGFRGVVYCPRRSRCQEAERHE
jgi:hypothetical protein